MTRQDPSWAINISHYSHSTCQCEETILLNNTSSNREHMLCHRHHHHHHHHQYQYHDININHHQLSWLIIDHQDSSSIIMIHPHPDLSSNIRLILSWPLSHVMPKSYPLLASWKSSPHHPIRSLPAPWGDTWMTTKSTSSSPGQGSKSNSSRGNRAVPQGSWIKTWSWLKHSAWNISKKWKTQDSRLMFDNVCITLEASIMLFG